MRKKVYAALVGLVTCLFWTWVMTIFNVNLIVATILGFFAGLFMVWMGTYGMERKE